MSNFRMDPGGEDAVKAMTMAKMREIDQALRIDLTGHETDEIEERARAAFSVRPQ